MKIQLRAITIKELSDGYADNAEAGVVGYGGKLDIRPPYPDGAKCECGKSACFYRVKNRFENVSIFDLMASRVAEPLSEVTGKT